MCNSQNVDTFAEACTNFGLTISIKKREVMHQPPPGKTYIEPSVIINGQRLKAVDKFTYLGNTLSRNAVIDVEMDAKANSAFSRLSKNKAYRADCDDHTPVQFRNHRVWVWAFDLPYLYIFIVLVFWALTA